LSLLAWISFFLFLSTLSVQVAYSVKGPIVLTPEQKNKRYNVALFSGGCFWCLEPTYETLDGVVEASVGYCGGKQEVADYYDVSGGTTDHLFFLSLIHIGINNNTPSRTTQYLNHLLRSFYLPGEV